MDAPYDGMADDEFYDQVEAEVAAAAGVPPEELDAMTPSEIEARIGVEAGEPHVPRGAAGRYPHLASDRYDVVTGADLAARRERVERFLSGERQGYRERAGNVVAGVAGRVRDVFAGLF